ncbi:sugar phosphate isomerase/epimerase [Microlunatus sp. Gsoil 973]|uniref:sugar phosphate isomerase/epimerase family protein n=1 Tax=Microlunatus sp. Gsoil 973 TaxID=2672569 RepID=UPI0018A7F509|nr:sugar phosphate isomerase/epimerase family protein [Microlunatus sp. Gsoil 973]
MQRVAEYLADAGYDAIEINGFRPHPHDEDFDTPKKCVPLRELLDGLGLAISGYAPDFRSTPPADVALGDYLARIDSALAFCRNMQISILRTDTVSPPGPMDEERFERLITAWRAAAGHAEDSGVRLIWEFEPGFWLNRPSQVVRAVEEVDHRNFSVLFDSSHAFTGAVMGARQGADPEILPGGVAEYARLLSGHIGHLHLIDSDGSLHNDETSSHLPFGQGRIDFDELVEAIPDELFALPFWTVDFCFCETAEADGRDAVGFVRELLNHADDPQEVVR